jgi:hypothetical protein
MSQVTAPLAGSPMEAPAPDWIPLSHAPFYTTAVGGWRQLPQFVDFIETVFDLTGDHSKEDLEVKLCFTQDALGLEIRSADFNPPDISCVVWAHPAKLEQELRLFYLAKCESLINPACDLASFLWRNMLSGFESNVQSGHNRIMARRNNPLAPFSMVPWDSWRHFTVTDWVKGVAEATKDERLYSIHVTPPFPETGGLIWEFTSSIVWKTSSLAIRDLAYLPPQGSDGQRADAEAGDDETAEVWREVVQAADTESGRTPGAAESANDSEATGSETAEVSQEAAQATDAANTRKKPVTKVGRAQEAIAELRAEDPNLVIEKLTLAELVEKVGDHCAEKGIPVPLRDAISRAVSRRK